MKGDVGVMRLGVGGSMSLITVADTGFTVYQTDTERGVVFRMHQLHHCIASSCCGGKQIGVWPIHHGSHVYISVQRSIPFRVLYEGKKVHVSVGLKKVGVQEARLEI